MKSIIPQDRFFTVTIFINLSYFVDLLICNSNCRFSGRFHFEDFTNPKGFDDFRKCDRSHEMSSLWQSDNDSFHMPGCLRHFALVFG